MRKLATIVLLAILALGAVSARAEVKNVIIFISDGWGENMPDATAYWNSERQVTSLFGHPQLHRFRPCK